MTYVMINSYETHRRACKRLHPFLIFFLKSDTMFCLITLDFEILNNKYELDKNTLSSWMLCALLRSSVPLLKWCFNAQSSF